MSLDNLHKRIDKLLAHIEQQIPERAEPVLLGIINPHLVTDQELERLQAYVAQVEPKIRLINGYPDLSEFTDQELDESRLWCALGTALEREDIEAAAKYRRWLKQDMDSLISAFLAIDETSIPLEHDQAQTVKEGHAIYSMTRVNYRSAKWGLENALARKRLTGVIGTMRRWVETFSAAAAA